MWPHGVLLASDVFQLRSTSQHVHVGTDAASGARSLARPRRSSRAGCRIHSCWETRKARGRETLLRAVGTDVSPSLVERTGKMGT